MNPYKYSIIEGLERIKKIWITLNKTRRDEWKQDREAMPRYKHASEETIDETIKRQIIVHGEENEKEKLGAVKLDCNNRF